MDTGNCIMYRLGLGLFGPGPQPFSQFLSVPLLPRRAHGPRLKMVGDRTRMLMWCVLTCFDTALSSMILNVDSALFHQQKCSKKSLLWYVSHMPWFVPNKCGFVQQLCVWSQVWSSCSQEQSVSICFVLCQNSGTIYLANLSSNFCLLRIRCSQLLDLATCLFDDQVKHWWRRPEETRVHGAPNFEGWSVPWDVEPRKGQGQIAAVPVRKSHLFL